MARRREWTGTPKQLHKALSKFRDGIFVEMAGWPKGLKAFAAALKKLEPKLADADLFLRQSDDGRLVIYRQSDENGGGVVLPLPFSRRTGGLNWRRLAPNPVVLLHLTLPRFCVCEIQFKLRDHI